MRMEPRVQQQVTTAAHLTLVLKCSRAYAQVVIFKTQEHVTAAAWQLVADWCWLLAAASGGPVLVVLL